MSQLYKPDLKVETEYDDFNSNGKLFHKVILIYFIYDGATYIIYDCTLHKYVPKSKVHISCPQC